MYMKEILIVLFIVFLIVINLYFLYIGKITAIGFSGILITIAISAVILYNINQVGRIITASGDIIEIRKIKADLYAKAEVVKTMGEEMGSIAAFNIAHLCRLAPDNLQELMIEKRDKLIKMLDNLGSEKEEVGEIVKTINNMVIFDLQRAVISEVEKNSYEIKQSGKEVNREEIKEEIEAMFNNYNLDGSSKEKITEYLKKSSCYTNKISMLLDEYEIFLITKRL